MNQAARTGPVTVVIGGGGGIGREVSRQQARRGDAIVVADADLAAANRTAEMCRTFGAPAEAHKLDITSDEEVADLFEKTARTYREILGVVNAAGDEGVVHPVSQYPLEVFERVMRINATGTFSVIRHCLPIMLRQGKGAIVAVASTSSIRGRANLSAYVASKHAVLGLVRSVALETQGSGVRVNAVLPGPIKTRMSDALDIMAAEACDGEEVELGRKSGAKQGAPENVADVVGFLLSDGAAHVTGASWVVDGGITVG